MVAVSARVVRPRFWGCDRLVLQEGRESWRVLAWPSCESLGTGAGPAVLEPAGQRMAAVTADGHLVVEGRPAGQLPAGAGPVVEAVWDGPNALVVVAGSPALAPPHLPGVSLLEVPEEGSTAQGFGSYPKEGMALWRLPLNGGPARRLAIFDGLERVGNLQHLGGTVAVDWYRYPAYGRASAARLLAVVLAGGRVSDLLEEAAGTLRGLTPCPDSRRLAFLHHHGETTFPFWHHLALTDRQASHVVYPLPEELRLAGRCGRPTGGSWRWGPLRASAPAWCAWTPRERAGSGSSPPTVGWARQPGPPAGRRRWPSGGPVTAPWACTGSGRTGRHL